MPSEFEQRLNELSKRVEKLEKALYDKPSSIRSVSVASELSLATLSVPQHVLDAAKQNIRRISYLDLVLLLMYYSEGPLTYRNLMSLTKELQKPVTYDWLDTEFHRKKYAGLVRSEAIAGAKERAYALNEPGRKRVEGLLRKLQTMKS